MTGSQTLSEQWMPSTSETALLDSGRTTYTIGGADFTAIRRMKTTTEAKTEVDLRTPKQIHGELVLNNALGDLHDLDPGWLDGDGERISQRAIGKARRRLSDMIAKGVAPPHVFPTPEGGVAAQWSADDWLVTITFKSTGEVRLFAKNLETKASTRATLELASTDL